MPEDSNVTLARLEEQLKRIGEAVDEIKQSAKAALEQSAEAKNNAANAKEATTALFNRIDEARKERQEIVAFTEQLKGGFKAATVIVGLIQTMFVVLIIWLFSSVSSLRESKAVLEYRLQTLEHKDAPR